MPRGSAWVREEKRRAAGMLPKWLEPQETKFETFLRTAGVKRAKAGENPLVRSWVKQNARRCYVPEDVLEAVGVSVEEA